MTRRILPIAKLLVWVVIAAALVKMAFFASTTEDTTARPWADFKPSTVVATLGTISNDFTVNGSVVADPATDVKSTVTGKVAKFEAPEGSQVEKGAPLITLTAEVTETDEGTPSTDDQGNPVPAVPTTNTYTVYRTIYANANGTVKYSVLENQEVTVGTLAASISPGTLSIEASLTPAQRYSLASVPEVATVTVTPGPGPFECHNIKLVNSEAASAGSQQGAPQGGEAPGGTTASSGAKLTCPVPSGITLYTGLNAKVAIHTGDAKDVVTVPTTAVKGDYQQGTVWVIGKDGRATPTEVQLGLTDGFLVEIKSGLEAGTEILEFVPGTDNELDPGMYMNNPYEDEFGSYEDAPAEDAPAEGEGERIPVDGGASVEEKAPAEGEAPADKPGQGEGGN
ncbi:MAG: efflux RND transporter periplasmic adaptor subunit [Buchananella hordeovulneris]|nr:efflux RND transporter periplasmic adaptor subunit [Buchananella hordeovulneris]